ncbi:MULTISPECIES: hypothetical protein [Rhodanobacter]|uniref:Uncharacterized protein n=2 Tax=Rhodanobacter TaxID=75309 RepID=A0A154QKT6_9GAMM|nr:MULTISPECIES: hypothetical protein [Rhodanobacter]AGG89616.1 hypothetical protein R2APBS1_2528 [Rhodanobacter denitrificans]KZC18504.1 hypothetical protein RHOFW104R3_36100 [Rhodanobacter denitrificans]KZC24914.1 hypothetical protein RHOFW104T7_06135 [Rhodanobacter thiooxydans]UJJ49815.1 hypothetical protein LRK52_11280 [Rhodanobacter denitrificans]UJJ57988.1 hypothetical protein LRK55_15165 [Rhodanobacter denitrificans]
MTTNHAQALYVPARPFALAIDRWIWVFMAAFFIAITLAGFIPDSLGKLAMVRAGARPPFPPILHVHAVLMGAFLLLLLTQAWLMATGRRDRHMLLGRAAFVLVPAIVVVGFILVPTIYQQVWNGAQAAPPPVREQLRQTLHFLDNIALLQTRIGIFFPLCIVLALRARHADPGFHKRMMFLAVATPLQAAMDRIAWLPTTAPVSPLSTDLYTLLAVSPLFVWDVARHRTVHRAYLVWLGLYLPFAVAVHLLWDTPGWHALVPRILGP